MKFIEKLKKLYMLCPIRHTIFIISLMVIALHLALRNSAAAMKFISQNIVQPINQFCTMITSNFSFSVAELLIACLIIVFAVYLVYSLVLSYKNKKMLYMFLISAVTAITAIYAGFCALWGCYFYDSSFAEKSGLNEDPISVEQLETVTAYFASLANDYAHQVQRDTKGVYTVDRQEIIAKSEYVYDRAEEIFPCLEANDVKVKGIYFSNILSMLDFTGFYFPFTGEANVNMDFPPSLFASTVAHEISNEAFARNRSPIFSLCLAALNTAM